MFHGKFAANTIDRFRRIQSARIYEFAAALDDQRATAKNIGDALGIKLAQ